MWTDVAKVNEEPPIARAVFCEAKPSLGDGPQSKSNCFICTVLLSQLTYSFVAIARTTIPSTNQDTNSSGRTTLLDGSCMCSVSNYKAFSFLVHLSYSSVSLYSTLYSILTRVHRIPITCFLFLFFFLLAALKRYIYFYAGRKLPFSYSSEYIHINSQSFALLHEGDMRVENSGHA